MKDREQNIQSEMTPAQQDLTHQANSSNLSIGVNVDMPDEAGKDTGSVQPQDAQTDKNKRTEAIRKSANEFLSSLKGRTPNAQESQTLRIMFEEMGLRKPVAGASTEQPQIKPEEEKPPEFTEFQKTMVADIEAVFDSSPQENLTSEAREYLKRFGGKTEGVTLKMTPKLRETLRQNGINDELISRYEKEAPEVLMAMLVARGESNRVYEFTKRRMLPEEEKDDIKPDPINSGKESKSQEEKPKVEDAFGKANARTQEQILRREKSLLGDNPTEEVSQAFRNMMAEAAIRAGAEDERIGVPNSLEDLAKLIMKSSEERWGENGESPLINKETGKVNVLNFLDWARNNYFKVHNFNSTNYELNFFSDLGTGVRNDVYGSIISFYEIVFTDSIWTDKETNESGKTINVENKDYEALRQQLIMEVFTFSLFRNPDLRYFFNRGQWDTMIQSLEGAFSISPLTRADFFEFMFTMPSTSRDSIHDLTSVKGKDEMQKRQEGNFFMGNAAREALAAYINIYDYRQLVKILGQDAPIFKLDLEGWDVTTGKRKTDSNGNPKSDRIGEDPENPDKRKNEWFYTAKDVEALRLKGYLVKEGDVKLYVLDRRHKPKKDQHGNFLLDPINGSPDEKYMDYINIFLSPNPVQLQQSEARQRVVLSIMEKNHISYREAQIAEAFAYSMTHVNGVAAGNDTLAVAFDWLTRVESFLFYRKRQKAERRGAVYGDEHNMPGFKKLGLSFFEAARDIRGRSIRSIIQGGTGKAMDIEGNPFKAVVDYEYEYKKRGNYIEVRDKKEGFILGGADDLRTDDEKKRDRRLKIANVKYNEDEKRLIYLHEDGQEVRLDGAALTKDHIIFRDNSGNIVDVGKKVVGYELAIDVKRDGGRETRSTRPVFIGEDKNPVDVHNYLPRVIVDKGGVIATEFKADLQKQFLPNHIRTAHGVYDFIMEQVQLRLPELVIGRDARGNPILDQKKVDELKKGIEKDIRYSLSTWPEINYAEKDFRWERVEIRNDRGKLVARRTDVGIDGKQKELELSEDWYIIRNGKKTKEKDEPKTYLKSREMTVLESMFGVDAIRYIQFELEKRGLTYDSGRDKDSPQILETITEDKEGKENSVTVDLTHHKEEDFRIAVWRGVFDYLIDTEIEAHRDWGSGFSRYGYTEMRNAKDALLYGGFITEDEANHISELTGTKDGKLFAEAIGYSFMAGAPEGLLKALGIFIRDLTK